MLNRRCINICMAFDYVPDSFRGLLHSPVELLLLESVALSNKLGEEQILWFYLSESATYSVICLTRFPADMLLKLTKSCESAIIFLCENIDRTPKACFIICIWKYKFRNPRNLFPQNS